MFFRDSWNGKDNRREMLQNKINTRQLTRCGDKRYFSDLEPKCRWGWMGKAVGGTFGEGPYTVFTRLLSLTGSCQYSYLTDINAFNVHKGYRVFLIFFYFLILT